MCFARSSREEVFHEKGVLKSFTKSTEKTFDEVSFKRGSMFKLLQNCFTVQAVTRNSFVGDAAGYRR